MVTNMIDRREEFKLEHWQQGRILLTSITKKYSQEVWDQTSATEKRMAFAYFSSSDEGRSRELIYVYDTKEECFSACLEHNFELQKLKW
jgi:hypothetical protein